MTQILALITLSESGIVTINQFQNCQKKEMEYVNKWKEEGILENFFISVSKKDAVLIFKNIDESKTRELIEILPYFPYMQKIEYHILDKQF